MARWIVHDVGGQPLMVEVQGKLIALGGRCLDASAAQQLRLYLGAALREVGSGERPKR